MKDLLANIGPNVGASGMVPWDQMTSCWYIDYTGLLLLEGQYVVFCWKITSVNPAGPGPGAAGGGPAGATANSGPRPLWAQAGWGWLGGDSEAAERGPAPARCPAQAGHPRPLAPSALPRAQVEGRGLRQPLWAPEGTTVGAAWWRGGWVPCCGWQDHRRGMPGPRLFQPLWAEPAVGAGGASQFLLELCAFAVLSMGGLLCPHSGHRDPLSCSVHWRPHHGSSHECTRTHAHQLSPVALPLGPVCLCCYVCFLTSLKVA